MSYMYADDIDLCSRSTTDRSSAAPTSYESNV